MSIGTRIIQIRNQKGLSQREVSQQSGIASSYLSRIENRRIEPGPRTLRKIASALGVGMGEVFQEQAASASVSQCVITSSGNCVMDLLANSRRKGTAANPKFTPRQVQLLRMADYLIENGNDRLQEVLEYFFESLLHREGAKREGKGAGTRFVKDARV
jgi:transcriptional regulator with XRE-family HTH domain